MREVAKGRQGHHAGPPMIVPARQQAIYVILRHEGRRGRQQCKQQQQ